MFDEEKKVLTEESNAAEEAEEVVSPENEVELEEGIASGLTDVDTVPLVQESFLTMQ